MEGAVEEGCAWACCFPVGQRLTRQWRPVEEPTRQSSPVFNPHIPVEGGQLTALNSAVHKTPFFTCSSTSRSQA